MKKMLLTINNRNRLARANKYKGGLRVSYPDKALLRPAGISWDTI